jgi:hypothetical protein
MIIVFGAIRLLTIKPRAEIIVVAILCLLPVTAFLRIDNRWDIHKPGFNPDLLVYGEEIKNLIPENAKVITANDPSGQIWFYYLDRSGWNFSSDTIAPHLLDERTRNEDYYFISDSRKLENDLGTWGKLTDKKGSFGSINVYKLAR